jgi:hypothetical protein
MRVILRGLETAADSRHEVCTRINAGKHNRIRSFPRGTHNQYYEFSWNVRKGYGTNGNDWKIINRY